jgi:hypothetical protein
MHTSAHPVPVMIFLLYECMFYSGFREQRLRLDLPAKSSASLVLFPGIFPEDFSLGFFPGIFPWDFFLGISPGIFAGIFPWNVMGRILQIQLTFFIL